VILPPLVFPSLALLTHLILSNSLTMLMRLFNPFICHTKWMIHSEDQLSRVCVCVCVCVLKLHYRALPRDANHILGSND